MIKSYWSLPIPSALAVCGGFRFVRPDHASQLQGGGGGGEGGPIDQIDRSLINRQDNRRLPIQREVCARDSADVPP